MHDPDAPPDSPLTGAVLADGKYEVRELVGQGAMGTVYRGRHTGLDRTVAIKVLHPDIMNRPKVAARFRREARAASQLQHANSVQVLDFGEEEDVFYIVMEFLEGRPLGDVLEDEGALPLTRIVHVMSRVCRALARAHDLGIIHRDMKPDNIVVFPGVDDDGHPVERVKVCDFGIAKLQQGEAGDSIPTITEVGQVAGTPHYMSPEPCQARPLDRRSDIYSCGVVLYHMATGDVPFDAGSAIQVMVMHISREPPRPSEVNPDISPELEQVIEKAMAKDPDARYPDARALRRALHGLVGQGTTAETHPSTAAVEESSAPRGVDRPEPATTGSMAGVDPEAVRRRPWLALAAGLVLLSAGAFGAWWWAGETPAEEPRSGGGGEPPAAVEALPETEGEQPSVEDGAPPDREPGEERLAGVAADREDAGGGEDPVTPPADPEVELASTVEAGEDIAEEAPDPEAAEDDEPSQAAPEPSPPPKPKAAPEPEPAPERPEPRRRAPPSKEVAAAGSTGQAAPKPASPEPEPEEEIARPEPQPVEEPPPEEAVEEPDPEESPSAPGEPEPEAPEPEEPPPPPVPTSFEATVGIQDLSVTGSLPSNTVERAVSRFDGAFEECYEDRAEAAGRVVRTRVRVQMTIDEGGRAREIRARGGDLPGLADCVRDVAWKIRTRTRPDTGTVDAGFHLHFTPKAPTSP